MVVAALPENESERLSALYACQILDTLPESDYDSLVFLAAQICGMPVALISLIDAERQWFKAKFGIDATQASRRDAFCGHTLLRPNEVLVVPDATKDPRFSDNPLVLGFPHIRFYAGAPIVIKGPDHNEKVLHQRDSLALGTICVISDTPGQLTADQEKALKELARQVGNLLDLRRHRLLDDAMNCRLREAAARLQESERRLNDAQEIARIGSWEFDVDTGKITWSKEMFRLLSLDPSGPEPAYEELLECYHPDDIPMYIAVMQQALVDGEPHELDIRAIHRDGTYRWLHAHGQGVFDDQGHVTRVFGTMQDVTDRKITQDALCEMATNLRRSNAQLQEFTSVASHDLKEPLRKIQSFGEMLKRNLIGKDDEGPEQALYYLERMIGASKRLQNLIDGLLTLARVSERATKARYTQVNLTEVAQDALCDLEIPLEQSGGRVVIEELPTLCADAFQMRQLLHNLFSNALKYRRKDVVPNIRLRPILADAEQRVAFAIQDNGIGFAPEDAERVFRVFERLDNHTCEGTGVGLAICQRIVEAHGGTIRAEGRPNEGATFIINLPRYL
jgi:PAS domain S-box-containing protein